MKPSISYSLLAAAFACGLASAQTTAYTTPVGYTTQTLAVNNFNVIGLNLLTPTLVQGTIASAVLDGTTTVITVTGATFTTTLPAGRWCVLEVFSGTQAGYVQEFTSWSNTTITLPAALSAPSLAALAGASYRVRVAPTLEEIFGLGTVVADSVLVGASLNPAAADKVWVPNGTGGYDKYYIKTNASSPARQYYNFTTGVAAPNIPLIYIEGVLVEKKNVANTLVLSGEVKTTNTNTLIAAGYNLLGVAPPVGLTLFTSGLMGDLVSASLNPSAADKVWIQTGTNTYTKYWHKSNDLTAPQGAVAGRWHTTTTGSNDTGLATDIALPASILIQHTGVSRPVSFDVPTGYSSL